MPEGPIKILVLAKPPQRLQDQVFLAKAMSRDNRFKFYFLMPSCSAQKYDDLLKDQNLTVLPFSRTDQKITQILQDRRKGRLKSLANNLKIKEMIELCSPYQLTQSRKILSCLWKQYDRVKEIFAEIQPDIVMVSGDRHKDLEPPVLKACKDLQIPSIVPYFAFSGDQTAKKMREGKRIYQKDIFSSLFTRCVFNRFPEQVFENHLFYTPSLTVALEKFGALSKNPWTMGNGLANLICVDDQHTYNRYLSKGVDGSKIRVIGNAAYDPLYDSYINKFNVLRDLVSKYDLDPTKKIVIVTPEPLAEHNLTDWGSHWQEINFLIESVGRLEVNTLVSLHPRVDPQMYSFLQINFKCKILQERLFEVLPAADLFVAGKSSTIVWSVLCGINYVTYDFWGYNYSMYDFLKTLKVVTERDKFVDALQAALKMDLDFTQDWKKLSRESIFDGKVIDRYIQLVKIEAARNRK